MAVKTSDITCLVAIARATHWVYLEVVNHKSAAIACAFLERCAHIVDYTIPQKKLGYRSPIQALQQWQKKKPGFFYKSEYNHMRPGTYAPLERSVNENTNGLIRQYFPKHRRLDNVSPSDIKQVMDKLNRRPRKSFGYRTPHEVFCKTKILLTVALRT